MKGFFSKINILEAFRQAKRPFVCLLVLCMIVTLIPFAPNINVATEVFADGTISGDITISSDTTWMGATTVSDGVTITINPNCTLTIANTLTVSGDVTINGGGTLHTSGASIVIDGITGKTFSVNDVTILGSTHNLPIIYYDPGNPTGRENIAFDNVIIRDANVIENSDVVASVLSVTVANAGVTMKDTTITDIEGGIGTVVLSGLGSHIDVEGNVFISNDFITGDLTQGGITFDSANNTGYIKVKGLLSTASNIAVNKSDCAASNPIICDDSTFVSSALAAFYVSDDFNSYGFTNSANNLRFTAKNEFTINYEGDGTIEVKDAHGRSVVTGSTSTTYTAKEISSREVFMSFIPASQHFVKSVKIGGTDVTSSLTVSGSTKSITSSAVYSGTNKVVFEQAITDVSIGGIIAPSDLMKAGDSLADVGTSISCTPASATVTIGSIAWYSGTTQMSADDKFVQGQPYTLRVTLSAVGGSEFDTSVNVNAAGSNNTGVASGSPALTTLSVSINYTATKMLLSEAERLHYVTITAIAGSGDATYDGQHHGPIIIMEDENGGQIDTSSSSAIVDSTSVTYSTAFTPGGVGVTTKASLTVNGPAAAKTGYSATVVIANTNYEGTKSFTNLSYTIAKRPITPDGILNIETARKYYDGTMNVTSTGLSISFAGVIAGDNLEGMYTASYAFDSADAGNRIINASAISLTPGTLADNYTLSGPTVSQSGATILQVAPRERSNSIEFMPVNATGTKLSAIAFKVSETQANWFENIYAALNTSPRDVSGSAVLIEEGNDLNLASPRSDLSTTNVEKNHAYPWRFTPSDSTNYKNVVGSTVFWPVAPIKNISLSGITLPVPGATNNITTNAVTMDYIGPSSGCEITIVSAEWKEHNPNTNSDSTLNVGDKFKYNRTYTLEVKMSSADKFTTGTGVDKLKVDVLSGAAYEAMTTVAVDSSDSSKATATLEFSIGKGTLTGSMFTVPGSQSVTYDGTVHYCTISSIVAEIDDGYLEYRTTTSGGTTSWTSFAGVNANAGLSGYRDAGNLQTYQVEIRHPDYENSTVDSPIKQYTININQKPITTVSVSAVQSRPYDNTNAVAVSVSSIDIISGDDVLLTAAGGTISNKNCTTEVVTVTASGISISGGSAGNYTLSVTEATTTGALNIIQKVIPTGGSVTWTAVSSVGTTFETINFRVDDAFVNPNIGNSGNIVTPSTSAFTIYKNFDDYNKRSNEDIVQKFKEYKWVFNPADSQNYNTVTGYAVLWPGEPISIITLGGITAPVAGSAPTAQEDITLETPEVADITVSAISWYEEDSDVTSGSALNQNFRYNRIYTLTVTVTAVAPDEFVADDAAEGPLRAGLDLNGGGVESFTVTRIDEHQAVLTFTFNGNYRTAKGTLNDNNLDARNFCTYLGDTLCSTELRGETGIDGKYAYAYVYTGRSVAPNPTSSGLQNDAASFSFSVDGGSSQSIAPRYTNKQSQVRIDISMTHPDYTGTITKPVYLSVEPCSIRPENVLFTPRPYDGTTSMPGAMIRWMPLNSGYELGTGTAIAENLIDYSANYVLDNPNVIGSAYTVTVTNIVASSQNFTWSISNVESTGLTRLSDTSFQVTGAGFIVKAMPALIGSTILNSPASPGTSLSALNYTTDNALKFKNPNRTDTVMYVPGRLGFTSGGAFMTDEELTGTAVVADTSYAWKFAPYDITNYNELNSTEVLYVTPPPTPSYGGGGGGGAAPAPTKAAVSTLSGVIATPGSFSTQIHVYLASGGSIVTDKAFFARVTGAAVDRALAAMPDGNVVVDRDGNIIAKAIIADGKLKAYLIGDNYLTIQRRKVDYIDVPGHWFEPYVDFCSVRDIMNGTGENKFSPNDTLTRAMAATILYRLEGSQTLTASNTRRFADVDDDKWYTDGIAWAGGTGIVNGIGIKNFAPHWDITREQMAVMIYNYCCTMCGAQPVPSGSLDRSIYGDGNKIASWAQDAVAYCTKVGLMKGNDKGDFCPKDTATRAEFATIIERLIEGFLDGNL